MTEYDPNPFKRIAVWLDAGDNRTIRISHKKVKQPIEALDKPRVVKSNYKLTAMVGNEPFASGGGTWDQAISYLEIKLFPELPA